MTQQTLQQVRVVDPILTNVVQGYKHPERVGQFLFPSVPVTMSGGKVLEFGREDFILYQTRRAPGANTRRIDIGHEGKDFALEIHDLEGKVPREHLRDASQIPGVDLGQRATNVVMQSMTLSLEDQQAKLAVDANNYGVNHKVALAGAAKWSDAAGTPTADIETAKEAVRSSIGMYPNTVLLSAVAFKACKSNPQIVERFKYVSRDSITVEMLANLWDVERVVVGKSVTYDPVNDVMVDVWGNNAVVAYVPPGPSTMVEPSYGYTYTMQGHPMVEQAYYDNNARSWIYPVSYERAPVLTGITAGYLIQTPN